MSDLYDRIKESVSFIRQKTSVKPSFGIVLGSGLGGLVKKIKVEARVPFKEIPNFPISTVSGLHAGNLVIGRLSGKPLVAMEGRVHYYEGYSMQEITFPVRVMKFLGADTLIVSNACGGLNPVFKAGELMIVVDHINLLGDNPLRGKNDERLGPRFPDMYNVYDKELVELAEQTAIENRIKVHKGVYVSVAGPNLETGAEYRMLRIIGADVVGMSTVPEVIVARHMGMKVLGISVITDMGLPDAMEPVSLEDVISMANKAEPQLTKLISAVVAKMA